MAGRPKGIDLFAGAGGLSLGFEQAGFDVVAAVEIDPIHAAVHKFNFPHCVVIPRSVSELTGAQIRELSGIGNAPVDVVFGGAPCQGFSLIGKRILDDPRNHLVRDFVRLVVELDANYFVFENVKGLTLGKHRQFLEELVAEFHSVGYRVVTPWKVLNAVDFGVPQNRERLFLLGSKAAFEQPLYPTPSMPGDQGRRAGGKRHITTVLDALGDVPDAEEFQSLWEDDAVRIRRWTPRSGYAKELHCESPQAWHYGYRRVWDPHLLTSSVRTDHSLISRRRFRETEPGNVEPISRFLKLDPSGVSNTLRAGTDSARGAFTSPRPIHYRYDRCVTVREMARLHGFPDWFRFHRTKWHGARQIGNSVPPPLARAVAQCVVKAMKVIPRRPARLIALGDENLLSLEMSSAAVLWGIPRVIGNRNQKSGARKRKQVDIEKERVAVKPKRRRVG